MLETAYVKNTEVIRQAVFDSINSNLIYYISAIPTWDADYNTTYLGHVLYVCNIIQNL